MAWHLLVSHSLRRIFFQEDITKLDSSIKITSFFLSKHRRRKKGKKELLFRIQRVPCLRKFLERSFGQKLGGEEIKFREIDSIFRFLLYIYIYIFSFHRIPSGSRLNTYNLELERRIENPSSS